MKRMWPWNFKYSTSLLRGYDSKNFSDVLCDYAVSNVLIGTNNRNFSNGHVINDTNYQ